MNNLHLFSPCSKQFVKSSAVVIFRPTRSPTRNRRRIESPATGDFSFPNRVCETEELFVDFIEVESSLPTKKHEAGRCYCVALPSARRSAPDDGQPRYRQSCICVDAMSSAAQTSSQTTRSPTPSSPNRWYDSRRSNFLTKWRRRWSQPHSQSEGNAGWGNETRSVVPFAPAVLVLRNQTQGSCRRRVQKDD